MQGGLGMSIAREARKRIALLLALLAYCLSALLHHAVQLQEDSDLTV